MSEEAMIRTVCSKCGVVYDLDRSLIGQFGECAECGAAFEITDQTDYVNQMLAAQSAQAPAPEPEAAPAYEAPAAPAYEAPAAPAYEAPAPAYEAPAAPSYEAPAPVSEAAPAYEAPAPEQEAAPQEGDVVMGQEEEAAPTNTVKLSRVSRAGMLPEVKDTPFKVGTLSVASQTVIGSTRGTRHFTTNRKFSSSTRSSSAPPVKKKRWWEFWK